MVKNEKGVFVYTSWEDVLPRVAGVVRAVFNISSLKLISKTGCITNINIKFILFKRTFSLMLEGNHCVSTQMSFFD